MTSYIHVLRPIQNAHNLRFGPTCINCLHMSVHIVLVGYKQVSIIRWPPLTAKNVIKFITLLAIITILFLV